MKKTVYFLSLISLVVTTCWSCSKEEIEDDKVLLLELSEHTALADGKTRITVTGILPQGADDDKTTITFKTSSGTFKGGETEVKLEATQVDETSEEMRIEAIFICSTTPGKAYITASVANIEKLDSVVQTTSAPVSVEVVANNFAVEVDYGSEIIITGTLKNGDGNGVSEGVAVLFQDIYDNGASVGGVYRETKASSNASSQVSTIYTPGFVPSDTTIYMKVVVLDDDEFPITSDSLAITLIQKQ